MSEPPVRGDAEQVLALALGRPPTLGAGRLVRIDGPAGSGKTTLAAAVADLAGARVVHLDDLYEGWDGLPRIDAQLGSLLRPLAEGRPGSYRRYDWHTGHFAETVVVEPAGLLVLEGVGSGADAYSALGTVLVWVEAPDEVRMRRGIERDDDAFAPYWDAWARSERALFARERTRERADLIVVT
ncbi:4-amino-4-deoxy-L-arabinose transferase [Nocardioides sp.]|uniref:4-amino-4-deoxy-L-arabinose transferase n=1 Tax=Nocardioides sp. TaxID=35761 RepID=UPI0039E6F052